MIVVVHQHIGVDQQAELLAGLAEQLQKVQAVTVLR